MLALKPAECEAERASCFSSIRQTLNHILAVDLLYLDFLTDGGIGAAAYDDYASAGRISTSVVLAFLLALPALARVYPTTRAWMWLPTIAWLAPWYVLLPLAFDVDWG